MMRTAGVQKTRQGNVEVAMIARKPGQRSGGDGDTVIGFYAADDLFLLRFAARVVEVPESLTCVSFASDPELQKNTFEIGTGA
jgi:hypothetical protein